MGREKYITKTVAITTVTAMAIDTVDGKIIDKVFKLFDIDPKDDILTIARTMYETDDTKIAMIKSTETVQKLAKMPLIKFYTSPDIEFTEPRKDYNATGGENNE